MKLSQIKKEAAKKEAEEGRPVKAKDKAVVILRPSKALKEKPVEDVNETVKDDIPAETNPKNKNIWGELLRFVVVGVVATIIDLVVELVVVYGLGYTPLVDMAETGSYIIWAIAVAVGFLVSNLANYFLSFIWVFQNVDRKKTKRSFKALTVFTLLSAIGLGLGIGLQLLGNYVVDVSFGIDLGNLTTGALSILQSGEYMTILAFLVVFVIKTAVTMVYNYVSRKLFIFRKPKENI